MSFWKTSAGTEATGDVQENSGFDPLPLDYYLTMLEEVKINEYQGDRTIQLKARIVGEKYKNRVLFLKLKCFDNDDKKRDRAINLLVKLYNSVGVKLPDSEPNDIQLSKLTDKPLQIKVDVFNFTTSEGKQVEGNFIVNFETKAYVVTDKDVPKLPRTALPGSGPANPSFRDVDDDIPF